MARSAARDRSEWILVTFLLWVFRTLPRGVSYALARGLTRLIPILIPRYVRVARRNLEIAFPRWEEQRKQAIIDGCFRNMARFLVGIAAFPRINAANIHQWIRSEGQENLDAALARGKGVLIVAGHLGNWELGGIAHALLAQPLTVVVRPLDNKLLDAVALRYRQITGNRVHPRQDPIRPLLQSLKKNGVVGIFIDQNVTADRGIFVDFFGTQACVDAGLARLAGHTGAAMLPVFGVWSETERRYLLRFYPPIAPVGDLLADTQAAQKALEAAVRDYPDQWLWIHRRWKCRPPGEPPIYE